MAGSRLQLDAPFGLSLLVSGRFYGIGNDALGVYCVSALVARPRWLGLRRRPAAGPSWRRWPRCGLLAVVASGWPGFGAKVGGTIALVPCLLLLARLAGRGASRAAGGRFAVPVALSGACPVPRVRRGQLLPPGGGRVRHRDVRRQPAARPGGDLLERKASANVGSLTLSVFGWLIPVAAVAAAAALWRPAALRLRTLADAFAALPLLRVLAWLCWLVLVIGWFADDSGVIVPAAALPFVVPLTIAHGRLG